MFEGPIPLDWGVKMIGRLEAMKQAAAGDPVIKAGIERIPAIERW